MDETNGVSPEDMQSMESAGQDAGRSDTEDSLAEDGLSEDSSTIGAKLRRARADAGLTLAEIAERTKVRPGILKDLEQDAHDRLPALTYTLGFVKAYARSVGLDPAQAADRYRQESQKVDPLPTMVDLQPLEANRLPSGRLVALTLAVVVLVLAGFWLWGSGLFKPENPLLEQPAQTQLAAADTAVQAEADAVPEVEVDHSRDPVVLTAREEVWLRVADGQEVYFTGILKPGESVNPPPGRGWKLRTGRAGALDVRVGEQALPPLGGPAQQLHDLSLMPADLLQRVTATGN